jgi:hypothetical protein
MTDIDPILKIFKDRIEAAERLSRLRVQNPKPVQIPQLVKAAITPKAARSKQ